MKKLFKKSIACLIAVLMVVSVMPLTMPLTTPVSVEAADVSSIQNLKFEKANATGKGYHYGNEATGGYDNILYCSKTTVCEENFVAVGDNGNFKTFSPNVVVMMYDGTTAGFPITVECKSAKCSNQYNLRYIQWNGNSLLEFQHPWYGYNEQDWTSWPNYNASNKRQEIPVTSTTKNIEMANSTSKFYSNEVYYKGTGNSTDYYESISGTTVKIDVNGSPGNKNTSSSIYILDYNTFYSKVETVKSIQKSLVDYPNRYTPTTSEQAINAVKAYYAANERVKTAFNSVNDTNAASTVSSVADDMKNAVAAINAVNLVCAHSKTRIEGAQAATCATAGKSGNVYCDYCDILMESSYDIPATGKHNYTEKVSDEVPANCTTTGTTAVYKCATCDATSGGAEIAINPNNHTGLTTLEAKDATCTETGLTEGQKCTACGKITVAQETVDKKPHTEVIDAAVAATCTETGLTEGKHCSVCGTITVAQETVDALGHDMQVVEGSAKDPTCTETGKKADKKCSRCDYKENGATIDATGHKYTSVVTDPTCTEQGYTTYTCSVCDDTYKGNYTNALGHNMQVVDGTAKDATCTEAGKEADKKCSRCNYTEPGATIDAKGHIEEVIPAVEATCTTAGSTAGTKCSVCGVIIVAPETIPAKGHSYNYTYNNNDTHTKACENCDELTIEPCTNALMTEGITSDTWHCTVCRHEYQREVANMTGLNDAIKELEALVNADDAAYKYTASALAAAKEAVAYAKTYASSNRYAIKEDVDAQIATVLSAETELTVDGLAEYTVKFELYNYDDGIQIGNSVSVTKKYGEIAEKSYTFGKTEEGFPEYVVSKWTKKVLNDKGEQVETVLNSNANDMSVVVKENATYTCYVLKFKASTEGENATTRVRYLDKSGKTLKIDYATVGKTYTPNYSKVPKIP